MFEMWRSREPWWALLQSVRSGADKVVDSAAIAVAQQRFVELVLSRNSLQRAPDAHDVEDLMHALDAGLLDPLIDQWSMTASQTPGAPEMHSDVRPFSASEWDRRHGITRSAKR